jgi:hypothetical protein
MLSYVLYFEDTNLLCSDYLCPHATSYVECYCYYICVLITLYMCLHSYVCVCVLLLYVRY